MGTDAPGTDTRSTLRLVGELTVITVYAFCVLWFFFDGGEWEALADMQVTPGAVMAGIVGISLWLFLAVRFVFGLVRSDQRRAYVRQHLGILALLAAVAFTYVTWLPALALALIVLGFVLELRRYRAQREWLTAVALILFISAAVSVGLVLVERGTPGSQLSDLPSGMSWTVARLLRVNVDGLQEIEPLSRDGRDLAAVLALCATMFAALIVGAIVSWLTKPDEQEEEAEDADVVSLTAEVAELREAVARLTDRLPPGSSDDATRT
jgi:voltage-gated potassium channel